MTAGSELDAPAQIGERVCLDGDGERLDLDSPSVRLALHRAFGWKQARLRSDERVAATPATVGHTSACRHSS
jgi:hypothetical protein